MYLSQTYKMQSEATDFAPVPPPGELDETYASSLIPAYFLHYMKTWRDLQNRKYITYHIAVRGGPSHSHGNMSQKFSKVWTCGF